MNLLHLHYFYVVAKEQGFTNASKLLRIQQPAISRMVKLLEDDFGFPLFEKVGRRVQLTKPGIEVFEHCKKIFGSVDELKQSIGKIGGECKGPVLIGAAEPIASHFLPKVIEQYLLQYPDAYPNVHSGPASMLFESLEKGTIEFGMFFHTPEVPEKFEIIETKNIRYHLVIKKELRRRKETIESFIGSREIDDLSNKRFPTLDLIRKSYPDARIRISSNNLTAHRGMVLRGLGVSVLPDFLVKDDLKEGRLAELFPNEQFKFKMKFIKRRTAVLSLTVKELIRYCLEG